MNTPAVVMYEHDRGRECEDLGVSWFLYVRVGEDKEYPVAFDHVGACVVSLDADFDDADDEYEVSDEFYRVMSDPYLSDVDPDEWEELWDEMSEPEQKAQDFLRQHIIHMTPSTEIEMVTEIAEEKVSEQ